MQTIAEPKEHIAKLWGKQRIQKDAVYRMMRYVLRAEHDGRVLLHNAVTGHLAVLDEDEAGLLDQLPAPYSPKMEQLVTRHYLVPESCDEHRQVIALRSVLQKLDAAPLTLHDEHGEASNLWGAFDRVKRNLKGLKLHRTWRRNNSNS